MSRPIRIESMEDPRVVVYRDVQDADLRGRGNLFMAESELVLRRLLRTPWRLHSVLLSENKHDRLKEALTVLPGHVPVMVAPGPLINDVAGFDVHRGVLAAGLRPRIDELSLEAALGHLRDRAKLTFLLAEHVVNVDNMGALFRIAAAMGVDGMVLDPGCCDPLYRKAIRVSMGHVLSVPYAVSQDWPADLVRLKKEWRVKLIAAELSPRSRPAWEMTDRERVALIVGGEETGISSATMAQCDETHHVPMTAEGTSLNVAVAAGVMLYELRRSGAML